MAALFQRACNWIAVSSFAAWLKLRAPFFVRTHEWFTESLFCGPSTQNAAFQRIFWKAGSFRPFPDGKCLPPPLNTAVGPDIPHLLLTCCPPAILWRVRSVIVNAIEFVMWGFFSHVAKEGREIISPPVAHGYATATVQRIILLSRNVASALSAIPRAVSGRTPVFPRCVPMLGHSEFRRITPKASTATRTVAGKTVCKADKQLSAVASAFPFSTGRGMDTSNCDQSAVAISRNINSKLLRHGPNYTTCIYVEAQDYVDVQ